MASLGHVAVGLAAARFFDRREAKTHVDRLILFGVLSLLPDADVLGFDFGVPYGSTFGHRGASHSLVAAIVFSLVGAAFVGQRDARQDGDRARQALRMFGYLLFVIGSHGLLDMLTDGGKGVAYMWPFSGTRFFFPWRPIPVAPIGLRVFSPRGLYAMGFELIAFAPLWIYGLLPRGRSPRSWIK